MNSLRRKFNKTFSFGTKVMEHFASNVATGWQYLFSDSNARWEFLTESNYDSSMHNLREENADEDYDYQFDYHLKDLFLPKEELYFGQQFAYPNFHQNNIPSVLNTYSFDQNNIEKLEINYPQDSSIGSIEDKNFIAVVENRNFVNYGLHNSFCNTLENNSSITHLCNDVLDYSKLSPVSNLNSASNKKDPYYFKDNIHFVTGEDIVSWKKEDKILGSNQYLENNQISSGNVKLEYKDALFASKNIADNCFFESFKLFLKSREGHNSSLNMPIGFIENLELLQHTYEKNLHVTEDNIAPCQIITQACNLNKHASEISNRRNAINCQFLHFLKVIFDFVKTMFTKINSADLFTYENQILFHLLRKKLTHFIVTFLSYISRQEQENFLFQVSSLISKIKFPKLDACAYHAQASSIFRKCLHFPKYSEIDSAFNLNKNEKVIERFNPDLQDSDWNMPILQTSIVLKNNNNKVGILHEAENFSMLDGLSDTNKQLYPKYNSNSVMENTEIPIVDNSSQICNNHNSAHKFSTKVLNTVFNPSKVIENQFETDAVERKPRKRKEMLAHDDLESVNLNKYSEVKNCQTKKDEVLRDSSTLQLTIENFSQNIISWDCNVNIRDDVNLKKKSKEEFGVLLEQTSQKDSKNEKNPKRKCFDCTVVLKDFKCTEPIQNSKLHNNDSLSGERSLSTVSKEENILPENRCRKRKNNSFLEEKVPNKRNKTGDEKEQKNITLGDQGVPDRRRSLRLLNKLKDYALSSNSTNSKINSKRVKTDSFCSKCDKNETFSLKSYEDCDPVDINEKISLKPKDISFDSSYSITEDFHLQHFHDESRVKCPERSISKSEHRIHQADIKIDPRKNNLKHGMDCKLKNGKNNFKKEKLTKKNVDKEKTVAIKMKTPSNVFVSATRETEKTSLVNSQSKTECNCRVKSVKKCRCLNKKTWEKIADTCGKNRNLRKQKGFKTQKSSPFMISSSQLNTIYSTDGNSFFQYSKTIQGTFKNPPSSKNKTNFDFGEQERFIGKRGQDEYSRSIFETKILNTFNNDTSVYSSPFYHFQNSNSGIKSLKRKHNFKEKALKCRKISDSKAVVKFSDPQSLPYPKIIENRMYFVQSDGKVNVATVDDLCLKLKK